MSTIWSLLIYTVPSQPSRLRATVWREVKKLGAVYLRDGVCVLPEGPATMNSLRSLARRIDEMGGQACLVERAKLDVHRAEALEAEFRTARADEYTEVSRDAEQLLAHIARETEHRDFTSTELEELQQDLTKLKRWTDQVHERDYFGDSSYAAVQTLLERCENALQIFVDQASDEVVVGR